MRYIFTELLLIAAKIHYNNLLARIFHRRGIPQFKFAILLILYILLFDSKFCLHPNPNPLHTLYDINGPTVIFQRYRPNMSTIKTEGSPHALTYIVFIKRNTNSMMCIFSVQFNGILQCNGHKVHGRAMGGVTSRAKSGYSCF